MEIKEIQQKAAELLAVEKTKPKAWHYLSFADDEKFRGAVVTKAHGMTDALLKLNLLGINPGGSVQCVSVPAGKIPFPSDADRLLNKDEAKALKFQDGN